MHIQTKILEATPGKIIGICSAPDCGAIEFAELICYDSRIETVICFGRTLNTSKLTRQNVLNLTDWQAVPATVKNCNQKSTLLLEPYFSINTDVIQLQKLRCTLASLGILILIYSSIRFSVVHELPITSRHWSHCDFGHHLPALCDEIWFAERPGYYSLHVDQREIKIEQVWPVHSQSHTIKTIQL